VLGSQKIIPSSQFLQLKDRGNPFKPSESVVIVCQEGEKCLQRMLTINAGKLPQGKGIVEAIATSVLGTLHISLFTYIFTQYSHIYEKISDHELSKTYN
jgi:hypothetical protein